MIRTVLTLQVAPGEAQGLVDAFRRLNILENSVAQDGCLSAEIAIAADEREAIVTATWEDEAAYERWTSRSDRGSTSEEVNAHLAVPLSAQTVGRVYHLAHRPDS
jgi:quinol monooxygenase YgiN